MKKITLITFLLFFYMNSVISTEKLISTTGNPNPCTSFIVNSENVLYGMNFDFPDVEIKLLVRTVNDKKIFLMSFKQAENLFIPIGGMNSSGLFGNLQMLFPTEELTNQVDSNQITTLKLLIDGLNNFSKVNEVINYIDNKKVVQSNVTLHSLFADAFGDGVIIEAGKDENMITKINDKFLIMTNFPVCKFRDKNYNEIEGVGADRYEIAYESIVQNINFFDRKETFETLEKAKMEKANFKTQCSLVFNPKEGNIYLSIRRDFSKIWKINISEQTIETFSGFYQKKLMQLNEEGTMISELVKDMN